MTTEETYLEEHVYFLQHAEENLMRALEEFDQDDAYTCMNLLYHYYAFTECQEKVIDALDDEEATRCKLKKHDWIRFARNTSTHGSGGENLHKKTICPEYDFLMLREKPSMRGLVKLYIEEQFLPVHRTVIAPKIEGIQPRDFSLPQIQVEYGSPSDSEPSSPSDPEPPDS